MGAESEENSVVHSNNNNDVKPLVILFGWAGAQDRYLAKYTKYYEEKGFASVSYTVPIAEVRSFSCYRRFALDVYEKVLDQEITSPIFFHLFSMNGCSLFTALWNLLDTVPNGNSIRSLVKGIIFDSSPANVMPWQAANAISFATLPPSAYSGLSRNTYRLLLTGIFSVHRAIIYLRSKFEQDLYEQNYAYFRLLKIPDLPKNQLYLYSQADDICSDHSIEEFLSAQKDRSCRVESKCWENSLHCQHYRQHPEEYADLSVSFIKNVLSQ
jgi:hypothetical protein